MAGMQGATWGLPGLLSPSYEALYGFSDQTIQLLLNYGPSECVRLQG
jgi:hypothetical protein